MKRSVVTVGGGGREMKRQSPEDFLGSKNTPDDIIMTDTCHYTFVQAHRMCHTRLNSKINYGLQVIMILNRFMVG